MLDLSALQGTDHVSYAVNMSSCYIYAQHQE